MAHAFNRTYSFMDVMCSVQGPGGSFMLSEGGVANEGISIMSNDRVTTIYGADGEWMHSLHGAKGGRILIRLLRTSPFNSDLSKLFNFDTMSSANCGHNMISVRDAQRGDNWIAAECAGVKMPDNTYATEGGTLEWQFNIGTLDGVFGIGVPEITGG